MMMWKNRGNIISNHYWVGSLTHTASWEERVKRSGLVCVCVCIYEYCKYVQCSNCGGRGTCPNQNCLRLGKCIILPSSSDIPTVYSYLYNFHTIKRECNAFYIHFYKIKIYLFSNKLLDTRTYFISRFHTVV